MLISRITGAFRLTVFLFTVGLICFRYDLPFLNSNGAMNLRVAKVEDETWNRPLQSSTAAGQDDCIRKTHG